MNEAINETNSTTPDVYKKYFMFDFLKLTELKLGSQEILVLHCLDWYSKENNLLFKTQDGKMYFKASYTGVLSQYPFLDMKHQRLKQIIDDLCEKEVLERLPDNLQLLLTINYDKIK